MNEERMKELLKQAVARTRPVNQTTGNFVKITPNTPRIQRTDNVYKKRGV